MRKINKCLPATVKLDVSCDNLNSGESPLISHLNNSKNEKIMHEYLMATFGFYYVRRTNLYIPI